MPPRPDDSRSLPDYSQRTGRPQQHAGEHHTVERARREREVLALAAQSLEVALPYLLAGVAGIFLYIAASDLIPEIHHRAAHKHVYRILIPFVAGLLIMGYLVTVTH